MLKMAIRSPSLLLQLSSGRLAVRLALISGMENKQWIQARASADTMVATAEKYFEDLELGAPPGTICGLSLCSPISLFNLALAPRVGDVWAGSCTSQGVRILRKGMRGLGL